MDTVQFDGALVLSCAPPNRPSPTCMCMRRHVAPLAAPRLPGHEPTQHPFRARPDIRRRPVPPRRRASGCGGDACRQTNAAGRIPARHVTHDRQSQAAIELVDRPSSFTSSHERLGAHGQNPITIRCCGWIPDLHLRRRWRWRHGDWSKQANASEDERDLRAQLPSRTVFRPQRIVISSQGEVHRQLATDLHDPAHVGAYRQGPGVVAGGAPVRGKDRRTADIPPAAKIVVPKRLDQEHVVARAGGRQERRRAIAPDSPTARPG